ncbi:ABC transporter ATP-binding protein [Microvirga massiliensis]|uniref:ABC transporter ATP-binding protein n=1 Tax=Microvirga massiliensis TaxID=1033741 RepID=UPI00062BA0CA|nr:ABC transporter ATP-binding protein [Microvirga massiliensis]
MLQTAGPAPVVLRLEGITRRFGALVANDAIDLELRRGEVLALLGENGAGKTTLMSILFGHYVADEGRILVDRDGTLVPLPPGSPHAALEMGIGMVHQHFTLADNLSVLDNIMLGTESLWQPWRGKRTARTRLGELMRDAGLTVDLEALVGRLSVGERQRVEILKALYRGARILILDEPTAVLTPQESEALFATLRRLAKSGLAIVLISHKLNEVLGLADRIAVLRGGRKVADLPRANTNGHMLAELMVGRAVPEQVRTAQEPGKVLLALNDVEARDPRGRQSIHDVTLAVRAGEIVGIAGVSGNGQGALAALLSGLVAPNRGEVRIAGNAVQRFAPRALLARGVGRIPEDRHHDGIVGAMRVWENIALEDLREPAWQRAGFLRTGALRRRAEDTITAYDVRCPGPEAEARLLSGGNIQKLILARVLERAPQVILASQPSRGLDLGAVAAVHQRLLAARARGAAILLISEDLDELLALSDRIAALYRGTLTPAWPTARITIRELGLAMAGERSGLQEAMA